MGVGCYNDCIKYDDENNCLMAFKCADFNTIFGSCFCLSECMERQRNFRMFGGCTSSIAFEDMCIFGCEMAQQIEKENYSYIDYKDALKRNDELFVLGLLGSLLQINHIKFAIAKKKNYINYYNSLEYEMQANEKCFLSLQFLSNLYMNKQKYDIHFDFGERINQELLANKYKFDEFSDCLKNRLSKEYNIPKDTIIITYPQRGSVRVQLIFESNEFDDLDINELERKLRADYSDYLKLKEIKEINKNVIMEGCTLNEDIFDKRGNRIVWGTKMEYRGNKPYYPPVGWKGYGLKVENKYENNDWYGMNNGINEWCVAYHGIGSGAKSTQDIFNIKNNIIKEGLRAGWRNAHEKCDDKYHKFEKVGIGAYCTPKIEIAERYARTCEANGKKYKLVFMLRVKPDAIRGCNCNDAKDYYVVRNGDSRPYRLLVKEIK